MNEGKQLQGEGLQHRGSLEQQQRQGIVRVLAGAEPRQGEGDERGSVLVPCGGPGTSVGPTQCRAATGCTVRGAEGFVKSQVLQRPQYNSEAVC